MFDVTFMPKTIKSSVVGSLKSLEQKPMGSICINHTSVILQLITHKPNHTDSTQITPPSTQPQINPWVDKRNVKMIDVDEIEYINNLFISDILNHP